jgi:hypothetical protein
MERRHGLCVQPAMPRTLKSFGFLGLLPQTVALHFFRFVDDSAVSFYYHKPGTKAMLAA